MRVDEIIGLDDLIILRTRPGLRVWCHADGAPALLDLDTSQRVIFCWSEDSTTYERDQARTALVRAGWTSLQEVVLGNVLEGEVEAWSRAGHLVLLDAPAANRWIVTGIEMDRGRTT